MSLIAEARAVLGELFIMGFSGLELSAETRRFLTERHIGGVIYFAHNYESPAQVAELSNDVQTCREDLPLWISVDQEGGRVQRFKKPFTRIPEAMAIAKAGSPKLAFEISEMMAKELAAVGVNLNFAPVADIHTHPKNPVIGNRAFGTTEEEVSKMVTAVVRGHLVSGVQACVKHFPGHGDTTTDSHFALPRIDADLETLKEREIKPFLKAFKSRCNFVMMAHILMPKIDPKFPATLSPKFIQEVLRGEFRYSKLVLSDDMEMKAITDHYGVEEAPRLAISAGCDLLIYRSEAATRVAFDALDRALADGNLSPERVLEAAARSRTIKREVLIPYEAVAVADVGKRVGSAEHQALVDRVPPLTTP